MYISRAGRQKCHHLAQWGERAWLRRLKANLFLEADGRSSNWGLWGFVRLRQEWKHQNEGMEAGVDPFVG